MPSRVAAGSTRRLYPSQWEAFFSVGGLWEGDCPEVSCPKKDRNNNQTPSGPLAHYIP